jgi:hypothetical protein
MPHNALVGQALACLFFYQAKLSFAALNMKQIPHYQQTSHSNKHQ